MSQNQREKGSEPAVDTVAINILGSPLDSLDVNVRVMGSKGVMDAMAASFLCRSPPLVLVDSPYRLHPSGPHLRHLAPPCLSEFVRSLPCHRHCHDHAPATKHVSIFWPSISKLSKLLQYNNTNMHQPNPNSILRKKKTCPTRAQSHPAHGRTTEALGASEAPAAALCSVQ